MNAIDIETVRLKLFDLQGLLAFTHEAVHRTTTCLEYDSREGLATILRECKELTQAALEELAKSKMDELVPKIRTGMLACPSGGENHVSTEKALSRLQGQSSVSSVDQRHDHG